MATAEWKMARIIHSGLHGHCKDFGFIQNKPLLNECGGSKQRNP